MVGVDTPNYGSTSGVVNYTITNEDIQNSLGSNIQFSVGIVDALDTVVDSYLKVSDFKISSTGSELDINGNGLMGLALMLHPQIAPKSNLQIEQK